MNLNLLNKLGVDTFKLKPNQDLTITPYLVPAKLVVILPVLQTIDRQKNIEINKVVINIIKTVCLDLENVSIIRVYVDNLIDSDKTKIDKNILQIKNYLSDSEPIAILSFSDYKIKHNLILHVPHPMEIMQNPKCKIEIYKNLLSLKDKLL